MKKRLFIPVLAIAAAGVLIYGYVKNRSSHGSRGIRVSGNIEVTTVELSFRMPGWVKVRQASEGQVIKAGQLAAELDATELTYEVSLRKAEAQAAKAGLAELEAGTRPEEIAQAEAAVQKAQSWLDELLAGSRPGEIAAAESAVEAARVDTVFNKTDLDRIRNLHETGAATKQEYDALKARYDASMARFQEARERLKLIQEGPRKEQIEQARAQLKDVQQRLALARKGPRQETIDQARARLEQAQAATAIAETRLSYATLTSPIAGLVMSENVEAGEYVVPGTPIVTVGDLEHPWLRAYINETDLGRVKAGQHAKVTTDTYPDKAYEGTVSFIASQAEFTPKNVQTQKERVKLVYRIKIDIANPNLELKPGMPADAEITVGQ